MPLRLAAAGTIGILAGEISCLVGPIRYERIVHLSCHAIFYAGVALVFVGAALHWAGRLKGRNDALCYRSPDLSDV